MAWVALAIIECVVEVKSVNEDDDFRHVAGKKNPTSPWEVGANATKLIVTLG